MKVERKDSKQPRRWLQAEHGRDGELIVWEANVMPGLGYSETSPRSRYLKAAVRRAYSMVLDLYYRRGGLEVPQVVTENLSIPTDVWIDRATARAA